MSNPFDNEEGLFHVLRNERGEYSLWPVFATVPAGWETVLESATREAATDYVSTNWTTLNPGSLADATSASPAHDTALL